MGSCGCSHNLKNSSVIFEDINNNINYLQKEEEIDSKPTGIMMNCCGCTKKPIFHKDTSIRMNNLENNKNNTNTIINNNNNNNNSDSSSDVNYNYPDQSYIKINNDKFKKNNNKKSVKLDPMIENKKSIFIYDDEGIINSRIRFPGN